MKTNRSKRLSLLLYSSVAASLAAVAALNFAPTARAESSAEADPAAAAGDDSPVLDTRPYELHHYDRVLGKSPFDFDAPPSAPPPTVRPMEGWAQAGISITSDYMSATLVNLKNPNERVRLTRYLKPEDQELNNRNRSKPKSTAAAASSGGGRGGRGGPPGIKMPGPPVAQTDTGDLKLLDIEFEQGKSRTYRNAIAVVSKAGVQDRVEYNEQVAQLKPAGQAMPNFNMNRGGMPGAGGVNPVPGQPGQPAQGVPGAAGNNTNAALMQLLQSRGQGGNAAQPQGNPQMQGNYVPTPPTVQPQPQPATPVTNTQPVIPALAPQPGTLPAGQTHQPGGQNQPPQTRRRVVLPTPEGQPGSQ